MTVETHDVNIIQNKLFAHMILIDDKKEVKFQLDSGATTNLIPKSYLNESTEIENSDHTLTMYNQSTMRSYELSDMIRVSTFTFVFVLSTL
jgi:hypothetical protein